MFKELLEAVKAQDYKKVEENLGTCDINELDENKKTPLYYAVANNNVEITKLLLKHGASTKVPPDNNNNNNNNEVTEISLLEDQYLKLEDEIKSLLLEVEKKLCVKTLINLEKEIAALANVLTQENRLSAKAQTISQGVVTTYTAALSAGCFYYGFYRAGGFFTALTTLMGAIDYKFYRQYKAQPHQFNCYRENLLSFVKDIKEFGIESTALEAKLADSNLFLTLPELLRSLQVALNSFRTDIENDTSINQQQVISLSAKFKKLSLFKVRPQEVAEIELTELAPVATSPAPTLNTSEQAV